MNYKNIFIIGAGPAGLACSYYLSKANYKVKTYEQNKVVGGLARSWNWEGFNLDTGPHIFHTPVKEIEKDWEDLFGDSIVKKNFYACNFRNDKYYDYPLNLDQLESHKEFSKDVDYLRKNKSFGDLASATSFEDYVNRLVGTNLSNAFFKEYPEKLWGIRTSEMSSEWAPKRIRLTNEKEKFFGNEFTAIGKKGTGEIMQKLCKEAEKNNCEIMTKCKILGLSIKDYKGMSYVEYIETSSNGKIKVDKDDLVILTIPLTKALDLIGYSIDLKFRGTLSLYLEVNKEINIIPDGYDWLYLQNKNNIVNRLCCPTNWSKQIDTTNENRKLLAAEISVNDDINHKELKEKIKKGYSYLKEIISKNNGEIINWTHNLERYVYPVKMLNSKEKIAKAKKIFAEISNVEILGTGANFNYGDMQIMFLKAKELCKDLNNKNDKSLSKISYINRYQKDLNNDFHNSRDIKIIAEIGINHNGSTKELKELIKEASNSGSQYIKFQYYKNKERISKSSIENKLVEKAQEIEETTLEILEENQLSISQLLEAKKITEKLNCIPMTTVFGIESLREALKLGFKNIKVASMDLNNFELHKEIITNQKKIQDVFISTGMSSTAEIISSLNLYKKSKINPIIMACTSAYPASDEDLNLLNIKTFAKRFKTFVKDIGYSDHSIGNTACIAAACIGANYLEIHFTNSNKTRGPDHILSATPKELRSLRNELDKIQKMFGSFIKVPRASEYETWRLQKKGVYAKTKISKGEKINLNNIEMKSPPYGILTSLILNRSYIAKNNIENGMPISHEDLSEEKKISYYNSIFSSINNAIEVSINKGKKIILIYVNTRNKSDREPFFGGLRESQDYILISLINLKIDEISKLNKKLNNYADFIFIDTEKSSINEDNLDSSSYNSYINKFYKSKLEKIFPIKPSKLTADAAIDYLSEEIRSRSNQKVGIIGLGNIGFRIAQELFEINFNLNIFSKDISKTIKKIEVIKSLKKETYDNQINLSENLVKLLENSDLIISCSSEERIIDEKDLLKLKSKPIKIIDVGKNNFTKKAISFCNKENICITRLDIGSQLIKEIDSFLSNLKNKVIVPKRRKSKEKVFVSGGFIGEEGDYVVDDADSPSIILGIINSQGKLGKI